MTLELGKMKSFYWSSILVLHLKYFQSVSRVHSSATFSYYSVYSLFKYFILSLWAWEALEYYSEKYCGDDLDHLQARFRNYEAKHRARVAPDMDKYNQECHQDYLESFTEKVLFG